MLRVFLKSTLSLCIVIGFITEALFTMRADADLPSRLRRAARRHSRYARHTLRMLGVQIRLCGDWRAWAALAQRNTHPWGVARSGVMVLGNHVSYLDPVIVAAAAPTVFVTSVETQEDGFLGTIAALGGAVFVERRNRRGVANEFARLSELLRGGMCVMIYPEATSTNGDALKPFKSSLIEAAVQAQAPVRPVLLRYIAVDGQPLDTKNRDDVFWYGDMTFFPHMRRLMLHRRVAVEIVALPLLPPLGERKAIAEAAHVALAAVHRAPRKVG